MNIEKILSHCDHTLLAVDAKWEDIKQICDDGMKYKTASVCIPASYVKQAAEYVEGKLGICTVIGFPNGYSTTEVKAFEAENAVKKVEADREGLDLKDSILDDDDEEIMATDALMEYDSDVELEDKDFEEFEDFEEALEEIDDEFFKSLEEDGIL